MEKEDLTTIKVNHKTLVQSEPVGIDVESKFANFLNQLHEQYGDFTITKVDNKIQITTK